MRKALIGAAAIGAAALVFLFVSLPAKPLRTPLDGVDADLRRRTVSGVYHIHTNRSDGAADKASVAAAAARAGLQFAIFTEHGDGTRRPDAPEYSHGVLCIDAVEVSTNGGHYAALDLPAAPYPLGGDASAVVEDVARLGGFGIVAHPAHPSDQLSWSDWRAPIDGLEWINVDSEWRDEGPAAIALSLFHYIFRPAPAIASAFERPRVALDRWDSLSKERRVVALAAVDAHGGAGSRAVEEGSSRWGIRLSYESNFHTVSNRVVLEQPLTGDAALDARLLLDAIRRGDVYSVVDAISPDVIVSLDPRDFAPRMPLPKGAEVVTRTDGPRRRLEVVSADAPGDAPVPWILTNWVGPAPVAPLRPVARPPDRVPFALSSEWRVEKDDSSSGRVSGAVNLVTLEYRLTAGERVSQYVAAAADLRPDQAFSGIAFRGRASAPMRMSVQLRFRPDDRRWLKSVYLGPEERDVVLSLADMVAAERGDPMPLSGAARSILFIVDLVNAIPGATGSFTISDLSAVR